jgi:hypothetical protein
MLEEKSERLGEHLVVVDDEDAKHPGHTRYIGVGASVPEPHAADAPQRTNLRSGHDLPMRWLREAVIVGGYDQSQVLAERGHGIGIVTIASLAGWLR